jgi:teichuronic acid biosynthesis glycosyltransferase TuaG
MARRSKICPMMTTEPPPPLVSVVMPVWNTAGHVGEAIASVRAQSFGAWELIVVDDASDDGSAGVVAAAAAGDGRIRLLRHDENRGAAAARNTALGSARGRFIAFLDSDDLWKPEKLVTQLAHVERTGAAIVFSAYERIDAAGRVTGIVRPPPKVSRAAMFGRNHIGMLTALYDTRATGGVRLFPDVRLRQDYGLWLSILRDVDEGVGLPEVLASYRVRPGSLSADKIAAARATWHVYRRLEGLPLHRALWHFAQYARSGIGAAIRRQF